MFGHLFLLFFKFFFHNGRTFFGGSKIFGKFEFVLIEFFIVVVECFDSLSEDGDFIILLRESFFEMGLLCVELSNLNPVGLKVFILFL